MIDMIPFYAEALAASAYIRKDIDTFYALHKEDYYSIAKNSKFYSHAIGRETSLLTEEYYKKAIGLLEYAREFHDEELISKIWKLFQKAYRKTYLFVKNKDPQTLDINEYLLYLKPIENHMNDDEANGHLAAFYFFTDCRAKNMDDMNKILYSRWEGYNRFISIDKISDDVAELLEEHYKKLPKNILDRILLSNQNMSAIDYIYDLEKLSYLSIFRELNFDKKDVKEILLCYIVADQRAKQDITLEQFLLPALHIKAMCKAYNLVKDMYFANNKETMYIEMASIKKELQISRSDLVAQKESFNQLLLEEQGKQKKLIEENELLQKRIKSLEDQMSKMVSDSKEVIALRDYFFKQESVTEEIESKKEIDTTWLNSHHGIIIGGHPNWQKKIKEVLPDWKIVSAGVNSLNTDMILDASVIIFNTMHLNHSLYYKVIDMVRSNDIRIGYLSTVNIEYSLNEIGQIICM